MQQKLNKKELKDFHHTMSNRLMSIKFSLEVILNYDCSEEERRVLLQKGLEAAIDAEKTLKVFELNLSTLQEK